MPQVNPTEVTSEDSQKQLDSQESLRSSVLEKIKGTDVFKSLTNEVRPEEVAEEVQEEPVQQEAQEPEETKEEVSEDEEVIPKSKIQPRIDQLTARLKLQQAEIEALKSQQSVPKDEIQSQLDAMNEDALEETLTQVRVAKEKARDDDAKLLELVKLERRVEKSILTAPQRFVESQVREFNNTVQRLANEGEINDSNYADIIKIAKNDIYDKYPKLAKSVDGQAMALELAVAHYKQLTKTSSVKVDTQNLKGQLNNLKKKTALDTKSVKSGGEKVTLDKLRTSAMSGTMKDKERFAQSDPRFKIDSMIPDFLKG